MLKTLLISTFDRESVAKALADAKVVGPELLGDSVTGVFFDSDLVLLQVSSQLSSQSHKFLPENLAEFKANAIINVFGDKSLLIDFADVAPVKLESPLENTEGETTEMEAKKTAVITTSPEFAGLCPTHPQVRELCKQKVAKLLELPLELEGIWLDNINYPLIWETGEPTLLDTCYCARCIEGFQEFIGEELKNFDGTAIGKKEDLALLIDGTYYHEWLDYKTTQIASLVQEIKNMISASGKNCKLGLFVVPWEGREYGMGSKRLLGQDLEKLAALVDMFSVKLYYEQYGKTEIWIKEIIEYLWEYGVPVLPFIKANSENVVNLAVTTKPSVGVCLVKNY